MGKAIEKIALERGHEIVYKSDKDYNHGNLIKADVAINFSIPSAAVNNVIIALENSIPVICGTTGWLNNYKKVTQVALHNKTAFLYASNFSIGVNLFFKLNRTLAKIIQNHSDYKASVEETHHIASWLTVRLTRARRTPALNCCRVYRRCFWAMWRRVMKCS